MQWMDYYVWVKSCMQKVFSFFLNQHFLGQMFMSPEMKNLANCGDWILALVAVSD